MALSGLFRATLVVWTRDPRGMSILAEQRGATRLTRVIHARRLGSAVRLAGWCLSALVLVAGVVAAIQRHGLEEDLFARENAATVQAATRLTEAVLSTTEAVLATAVSAALDPDVGVSGPEIHDLLRSLKAEVPFLTTLVIVGVDGRIMADGREGSPGKGLDVSDRQYFRHHMDPATPPAERAHVGEPIASRVDGALAIPMSRAIRTSNGQIVAILVTGLDIAYLQDAFAEVTTAEDAGILLARMDGPILACWPLAESKPNGGLAAPGVLHEVGQGDMSGRFTALSQRDGVERFFEYKRLADYPVFLASWRGEVSFLALAGRDLLPWLIIAALAAIAFPAAAELIARALTETRVAMERAERADDRKTQFLANTSHELRTPLNAILGYAEILRDDLFKANIPARYRDYAGNIHDSGAHLLAIVNDLLDLNTLLRGDVPLARSRAELTDMLSSAIRLSGLRATVQRAIAEPDPATLEGLVLDCDERRTVQAIVNLLANAMRHTPEGTRIVLQVETGPPGVVITVEDDGPGLPASVLRRLGEPFPISADSYVSGSHGTGLGLAITHRIMALQDGTLKMTNRPGGGARAELHFPEARVLRGA